MFNNGPKHDVATGVMNTINCGRIEVSNLAILSYVKLQMGYPENMHLFLVAGNHKIAFLFYMHQLFIVPG